MAEDYKEVEDWIETVLAGMPQLTEQDKFDFAAMARVMARMGQQKPDPHQALGITEEAWKGFMTLGETLTERHVIAMNRGSEFGWKEAFRMGLMLGAMCAAALEKERHG